MLIGALTWEGWYVLALIALVFVALARDWAAPDVLMMGAAVMCGLAGIITPAELVSGFSNKAVLTVAALFVVAAALRETGALDAIGRHMLGGTRSETGAITRMALQATGLSAFLNNTPIVAMLLPVVTDWCRKNRVSPSRLLIPLAFFTTLGGTCTLIGTSTNLTVNGLLEQSAAKVKDDARLRHELREMWLFEITPAGVLHAVVGVGYVMLIGRRLLPDRKDLIEQHDESSRQYLVNMLVRKECRLVGQTIGDAGLRHLPGLFLIEIERGGHVISPVGPDERLMEDDRLTFTGVVDSIVDLERIFGLVPVSDEVVYEEFHARRKRRLCEAVISWTNPVIGKSVRDAEFRARFNAAVIAVHRGGLRLEGRIGDIVLRGGDTLLLQTDPSFPRVQRNNTHFYLVSSVEEARPVRHERALLSIGLLAVLIVLMSGGWIEEFLSAFLIAGVMIGTRCISAPDARRSIDYSTLLTIAASLPVGAALSNSGVAEYFASSLVELTRPLGGIAALACITLVTMVATEFISNNAAAAMVFPLALGTAAELGVGPRPFVMAVCLGASAAYATPIGYQTNMMVYGPGGYRFNDFLRIGVPMDAVLWITGTILVSLFWPITPL